MRQYLKWTNNNFGDELNDLIFPSLGYKKCLPFKKENLINLNTDTILGLGTLLTKKIKSPITVAGSGSDGVSRPNANLNYAFVRGKLTVNHLNLDNSLAVGDPAYYLSNYITEKSLKQKKLKIGIIPHWSSMNLISAENIISPMLSVDQFIKEVSKYEIILAEAMHGAICADILRIPFAPVKIGNNFNEFKWLDWASVMNLDLQFGSLDNYKLYLSKDNVFDSTVKNVTEKLEGLRC